MTFKNKKQQKRYESLLPGGIPFISQKPFKMKTKNVDKNKYEVFEYIGGYFGICKIGDMGRPCVFGGDSACEDHYNERYITDVFNQWNGELHYDELYGTYRIQDEFG